MDADETFAIRCAHARVLQADRVDEDIVEVIDEVRDGRLDPQAARVALAGMQWRASKLAPKKYGDRLDVNTKLSGGVELKVVTEFGE